MPAPFARAVLLDPREPRVPLREHVPHERSAGRSPARESLYVIAAFGTRRTRATSPSFFRAGFGASTFFALLFLAAMSISFRSRPRAYPAGDPVGDHEGVGGEGIH